MSLSRGPTGIQVFAAVFLVSASVLFAVSTVQASGSPGAAASPDWRQAPSGPGSSMTVVVKVNANLRQGPGTTYPIGGGALAGQTLMVIGQNQAGDWYQLAGGAWIFASLVEGAPDVPVAAQPQSAPAAAPASGASPALGGAPREAWTLVADSAADFPGGRDRNHWYYLWTEGRGNFHWQEMRQIDG